MRALRVGLRQVSKLLLLDDVERAIAAALSRNPSGLRGSGLVEAVGVPKSTVYKKLRRLVDAGLVREEGGYYRLSGDVLGLVK